MYVDPFIINCAKEHTMHLASSLLSSTIKRLTPSVYGVSLKGVHVQTQFQIEHISAAGAVPDTVIQVGEDASFVCMSQSSRHHVCGVADGVGGWMERGVDPSFFSKFLMESCYRVSARESVDLTKPVEILTRALSEVKSVHSKCYGSSTACVLSLDSHSGILHSANIGDSGYVVFRKGEVIEESQPLTHYFNCPYQLSNPPPGFNKSQVDRPSAAVTSSVQVEDGDLIVLASDGLFNNMYPSELAAMLKDFEEGCITGVIVSFFCPVQYSGQAELDDMVKRIVQKAHHYSMDPSYMSPFAQLGSQILSWEFEGGKLADITVLLLAVTKLP